jgi:hypothetical protein
LLPQAGAQPQAKRLNCLRPCRREGILFNANATGFRRVHDWLDVEKMFLGLVNKNEP